MPTHRSTLKDHTETSDRSLGDHSFVFYGLVFFGLFSPYFLWPVDPAWWLYARSPENNSRTHSPAETSQRRGIRADIRLSVLSASFSPWPRRVLTAPEPWLRASMAKSPTLTAVYCLTTAPCLILQDALYYASHRLFHHAVLRGCVTKGHHRTRQPTP